MAGRRVAAIVVAAAVGAAGTPKDARAALFFLFEPTVANPGDLVTVRTGGTPAAFAPRDRTKPLRKPIRVYLVWNALAPVVHSRFDPRLQFIGLLTPDARGLGVLTFTAPPLDSDSYAVAAWCPGCARYSGGRRFFVLHVDNAIVPEFRHQMLLRLNLPAPDTCPTTTGKYGNGLLSTTLTGDGAIVRSPEPDGSIFWKFFWTPRNPYGGLIVHGERLDARSPPMQVIGVHWGESSTGRGGWASAVLFPSEGCWRVTGRIDDVSLTFAVKVVRGPARL